MAGEQSAGFWTDIRGYRSPPPPVSYVSWVPSHDADEADDGPDDVTPEWEAQSITGRTFVLSYVDSKRQPSERLVLCRRLSEKAGTLYLDAYCYVRERPRSFRAERIVSLIDHESGEVHAPGLDYLSLFLPDATSSSPFHYGLHPRQYADLNAALNVLAFMARCDGKWHPLEATAIVEFAASYWLRAEVAAELDEQEVVRHAARLAPDAAAFWVSLSRCASNPILNPMIRRHVASVIDADGVHHPLETYWGMEIDRFMRE